MSEPPDFEARINDALGCLFCGAAKGAPCVEVRGRRRQRAPHAKRYRQARAAGLSDQYMRDLRAWAKEQE